MCLLCQPLSASIEGKPSTLHAAEKACCVVFRRPALLHEGQEPTMLLWRQIVGNKGSADFLGNLGLLKGPAQHGDISIASTHHQSRIVDRARRILSRHPLQHFQIARDLCIPQTTCILGSRKKRQRGLQASKPTSNANMAESLLNLQQRVNEAGTGKCMRNDGSCPGAARSYKTTKMQSGRLQQSDSFFTKCFTI